MYSLDCNYYHTTFDTLEQLLFDVLASGMDPNYEITKDGVGIGEKLKDHLVE